MARILHVYKDYYPVLGGIESTLRLLAREQLVRGHDVTVLVTNTGRRTEESRDAGVRVIRASRLGTVTSTPLSASMFLWMRRLEADITHLHFPYPPAELAYLLLGRSRH